jgi:hypothetical protein
MEKVIPQYVMERIAKITKNQNGMRVSIVHSKVFAS